ncbi:DNA polymerase III subunit gamma and tau, partial [Streptomyces tunisiensis]
HPGKARPVPPAGRPTVPPAPAGRPTQGPAPARAPEYPPYPRTAEPDPGWPGAGSAAPWGVSDTDGDADWPDEEITPGGDARESWEGSA